MKTTCATCEKEINIKPANYKPGRNFCSRHCHNISGLSRPNRKTGKYRTCPICKQEFYVSKSRLSVRKYCSKKCMYTGLKLPEKQCIVCNKTFKPLMGRSHQPTCSIKCGGIYRRSGQNIKCKTCGKTFYVIPARIKANARFCSRDCANEWQGRNKTTHTCKICGQTFRWSPSRTTSKQYNVTYCSLACRDKDPERVEMLRQMNMNQQYLKPNKLEKLGYSILDEIGIKYTPQYLIAKKFCVDAFAEAHNLIIQFDGDYWHGFPEKYPEPDKRQQKRMNIDKSQNAYFKKCGYKVIRIWEHQLRKQPEQVKQLLISAIQP